MSDRKIGKEITAQGITFLAVFAALTCLATFISVPLPIGYFNLGDVFVVLSAWCLGPFAGAIAAGVGSAISDLLMGYAVYAPATLVIKAGMALTAYFVYLGFEKLLRRGGLIPRVLSATLCEGVMIGGYFLYECFVLGYGLGAVASVAGNCLQGGAAVVISTALIIPVKKGISKVVRK